MESDQKNEIRLPRGVPPWAALLVLIAVVGFIGSVAGVLAYRVWLDVKPAPAAAAGKGEKRAGSNDPGSRYAVQFGTETLFPAFEPGQRRYVTRCAPAKVNVYVNAKAGARVRVEGSRPATGRFRVEARPTPGQDFGIEVAGAGPKFDGEYRVRCLPTGFPEWGYERFRKPPNGTFVVAFRPAPIEFERSWVIAFDQDGLPVWWFSPEVNALWAQVLPDGRVHWARGFGDGFGQDDRGGHEFIGLDGEPLGEIATVGAPNDAHELVALPNGNYFLMSYKPRFGVDLREWGLGRSKGVLDAEIQEVTPDGRLVWRWNSGDHIPLDEVTTVWQKKIDHNPHADREGRDRYDIFHLNSIEPIGRDRILISTRHTDAVYMLSRETGEVIWKLGGEKTPESLRIIGPEPNATRPLAGPHDAKLDGDVLSIHDNGTHAERPPRLVRYRIDAEAGTARFLSQVTDRSAASRSHCCGGARRFGDGWIVSWGNNEVVGGFDRDGLLAFRLKLAAPSYRAIPVPSSVGPAELDRGLEAREGDLGPPSRAISPIKRFSRPQAG